jgi:hypothetical protein
VLFDPQVADKLVMKHRVTPDEVRELFSSPLIGTLAGMTTLRTGAV